MRCASLGCLDWPVVAATLENQRKHDNAQTTDQVEPKESHYIEPPERHHQDFGKDCSGKHCTAPGSLYIECYNEYTQNSTVEQGAQDIYSFEQITQLTGVQRNGHTKYAPYKCKCPGCGKVPPFGASFVYKSFIDINDRC